jgi:hypothetical protein
MLADLVYTQDTIPHLQKAIISHDQDKNHWPGIVVHVYNLTYSGGGERRPTEEKVRETLILK